MTITTMRHQNQKDLNKRIPLSEALLLSAVFGSIVGSVFLYFYTDNPLEAIFVGLWAPTIMSLINFINLKFKR
jgi:hypothetical protein